MSSAAAPSLRPEALPAVTVPLGRKAGRSPARPSRVVPGLANSSWAKTMGSPLRCGIETGASSPAMNPRATAAAVRCWLRRARASWSSREIPYWSARFSAVSPMASVP